MRLYKSNGLNIDIEITKYIYSSPIFSFTLFSLFIGRNWTEVIIANIEIHLYYGRK